MTATAVKTTVLSVVAVAWSVGGWILGGVTGISTDSAWPFLVSGVGGASVTGAGAFVWVRFVTRGMNTLIDQQTEAIQLGEQVIAARERRIHELETILIGGTP